MSFSTNPDDYLRDALDKGYVGARIEQGVPVLDRDLNLLGDFPLAMLRTLTAEFIGVGVREGSDAFSIEAVDADNDFDIVGPGVLVVDGMQIRNPATVRYSAQSTTPPTAPTAGRQDLVYLDVLTRPTVVGQTDDPDLENRSDVGQQTSVRLMTSWQVRVAAGTATLPPAPAGHVHAPLAVLVHRAVSGGGIATVVTDQRPRIPRLQTVGGGFDPSPLQAQIDALNGRVGTLEARLRRRIVDVSWEVTTAGTQPREVTTGTEANLVVALGYLEGPNYHRPFSAIASRTTDAGATSIRQVGTKIYYAEPESADVQMTRLVSVGSEPSRADEETHLRVTAWNSSAISLALYVSRPSVQANVYLLII